MAERKQRRFLTLIAGPTASGKSALAARLAIERGALIVNADSMQVYKELRILTARPSAVDERLIPHRLYGFRSAADPYSVAAWLADVAPLIANARAGAEPLVIVGGTGLYFNALLEGLSPVPEIPDAIRRYWRTQAATADSSTLHAALAERDPAIAARIAHTDPQRIVRALEVLDATGQSLLDWQKTAGSALAEADETERLFVCPPRDVLYARGDARLDQMIAGGALDEVRELASLGLDPGLPAMRALGVRPFLGYLNGLLAWEAAVEAAKTETRRYAKRQMTWARSHMISWNLIFAQ